MKTVRIFRTNVFQDQDASQLASSLHGAYPHYKVNFDLTDEERILRVETQQLPVEINAIVNYMMTLGYQCEHIE